jgi:hypothetical protein
MNLLRRFFRCILAGNHRKIAFHATSCTYRHVNADGTLEPLETGTQVAWKCSDCGFENSRLFAVALKNEDVQGQAIEHLSAIYPEPYRKYV